MFAGRLCGIIFSQIKQENALDGKIPSDKDARVVRHPLVLWLDHVVGNTLSSNM